MLHIDSISYEGPVIVIKKWAILISLIGKVFLWKNKIMQVRGMVFGSCSATAIINSMRGESSGTAETVVTKITLLSHAKYCVKGPQVISFPANRQKKVITGGLEAYQSDVMILAGCDATVPMYTGQARIIHIVLPSNTWSKLCSPHEFRSQEHKCGWHMPQESIAECIVKLFHSCACNYMWV